VVLALSNAGIETIENCEGVSRHAFRGALGGFCGGGKAEAQSFHGRPPRGLKVAQLSRVWPILDSEPTYWELTFWELTLAF
jgi:hypothetical protein